MSAIQWTRFDSFSDDIHHSLAENSKILKCVFDFFAFGYLKGLYRSKVLLGLEIGLKKMVFTCLKKITIMWR